MRVLVACEFSGRVRDAFIRQGHDAMSCDFLPTEVPGPHYQGDVMGVLYDGWDLMIAHPTCTYLANSGVRWFYTDNQLKNELRWIELYKSVEFFNLLLDAPISKIAIENPIQHKHARNLIRKQDQIIQPWQFGHGETKATCLWLKNLNKLIPTNIVDGREARVHREAPSSDRWKNRSRTYTGIAEAMAQQWGGE